MLSKFFNDAGIDLKQDDSRQLRDRLHPSGAPVSCVQYRGVLHGFTQFTLSYTARKALSVAGAAIKESVNDKRCQTRLALQQAGLETDGDGMTAIACAELVEHVAEVEADGG